MRKKLKRALAFLLIFLMFWQSQITVQSQSAVAERSAAAGNPLLEDLMRQNPNAVTPMPIDPIASDKEINEELWEDAKEATGDAAEEAFSDEVVSRAAEFGKQAIDDMRSVDGSMAGGKIGSVLGTVFEAVGFFISVFRDAASILNLQSEHVLTQLTEIMLILGDLITAVLALFGVVSFPWSLILGAILSLLLGLLQSEGFADWVDRNFGREMFDVDAWLRDILSHNKSPDGVGALKPNIYIYSRDSREVRVTFDRPELLTTSIPDYSGSWQVTAQEDGTLTAQNGDKYGYLFYESQTWKSLFQTEAGYRIPADGRDAAFRKILTQMGFTQQEILDFTQFWDEKLPQGQDYIMYPQDTDRVNMAMPVTISPAPDSLERIWFAFEADCGQELEQPQDIHLNRSTDYCVVEWGGMIFREH